MAGGTVLTVALAVGVGALLAWAVMENRWRRGAEARVIDEADQLMTNIRDQDVRYEELLLRSREVHRSLLASQKLTFLQEIKPEDARAAVAKAKAEIDRVYKTLDRRDHFQLLGVDQDTGPDKLRQSFHRLAKRWHTDNYADMDLGAEIALFVKRGEHASIIGLCRRNQILWCGAVLAKRGGGQRRGANGVF